MKRNIIAASASALAIVGIATGVALAATSNNTPAPKQPVKVASVPTTPEPVVNVTHSAAKAAPVTHAAVKRHTVVAPSEQTATSAAPVIRKAAVVTDTSPAADPVEPVKVSDPATQGPNGGPLPTMAPPQAPTPTAIKLPDMSESPTQP